MSLSALPEERRLLLESFLQSLGLPSSAVDGHLLDTALTHRSWAKEKDLAQDNERLELLGDAVIGLFATQYLYETKPDLDEGGLSKLKAALVSRRILGLVARDLGIGSLLRLGVGETAMGGAEKLTTLGSALEAVLGALYLSLGHGEVHPAVVRHVITPALARAENASLLDSKSALQEWAQQQHGGGVPTYEVMEEFGPDHDREFVVSVSLNGKRLATGVGKRKQWAEKAAAELALKSMTENLQD